MLESVTGYGSAFLADRVGSDHESKFTHGATPAWSSTFPAVYLTLSQMPGKQLGCHVRVTPAVYLIAMNLSSLKICGLASPFSHIRDLRDSLAS